MSVATFESNGDIMLATPTMTQSEIRPFSINVSEEELSELRQRIAATH
jgi:hypothetical protein